MRVGIGYDVHALVKGRRLVLGGVVIPFEKGLEGHSDADVLCHAIGDALLGAAALGDIGEHFPDTDPEFKDVSSLFLLRRIGEMVSREGFRVVHADSTVVAQAPKLSPFKDEMVDRISDALNIERGQVSVKATTNEGFGAVGRSEAIAAFAVVLIETTR